MYNIDAELLPLPSGKYYKSSIRFTMGNGQTIHVSFVCEGSHEPSDRWLEDFDMTIEQWRNNEMVPSPNGGMDNAKEVCFICDEHFENRKTHELGKLLESTAFNFDLEVE